jgi:hypothetical protein
MKTIKWIGLVLVMTPALVLAQKKAKIPALFDRARFVYVEAMSGDEFKPGVYSEDRRAIEDVRNALETWGRYELTTQRSQADLVFLVRKGRLASANLGGGASAGSDPQASPFPGQRQSGQAAGRIPQAGGGIETGAEAGPPDDLLEVCTLGSDGKLSSPIWYRMQEDGLASPRVPLFAWLKSAVERDYPSASKGAARKP